MNSPAPSIGTSRTRAVLEAADVLYIALGTIHSLGLLGIVGVMRCRRRTMPRRQATTRCGQEPPRARSSRVNPPHRRSQAIFPSVPYERSRMTYTTQISRLIGGHEFTLTTHKRGGHVSHSLKVRAEYPHPAERSDRLSGGFVVESGRPA